ncbi:hypothetical protein ACTHAL_001477 [Priestia flexa]|uniref:hypothetical protein n=1 Tax=Priestia flexa TaxID=86664 RepID=UPI003F864626
MDKIKWYEDEEQREFVLMRFREELLIRTLWVTQSHQQIHLLRKEQKDNLLIMKEAMDLINNALVMDRITDKNATGARKGEISLVKKRVTLIRERWPGLPESPPEGLRLVRNHYEHFDTRLDYWAKRSKRDVILDLNVLHSDTPIDNEELGFKKFENLRSLRGNILYYCDSKVDLDEVVNWATQILYVIH